VKTQQGKQYVICKTTANVMQILSCSVNNHCCKYKERNKLIVDIAANNAHGLKKLACKMLHAAGSAGWHASHKHEALMLVEQNKILAYIDMQLAAGFQWRWALRAGRHVSTLFSAANASFNSSASCCMENWKLYHRTWTHSRLIESITYSIDPILTQSLILLHWLWQSLYRQHKLTSWQQAPSIFTSDAGIHAGVTILGQNVLLTACICEQHIWPVRGYLC